MGSWSNRNRDIGNRDRDMRELLQKSRTLTCADGSRTGATHHRSIDAERRLGECCRQTWKSCSVFRNLEIVRRVVRSCAREICVGCTGVCSESVCCSCAPLPRPCPSLCSSCFLCAAKNYFNFPFPDHLAQNSLIHERETPAAHRRHLNRGREGFFSLK